MVSSDPSMMLNTHGRKGNLRHNNALLCLVSLTSISWTGLATYRTPRAIATKLLYQQSSSTTSPYSYALSFFIASKGVFRPSSASVIS
ncbi:hypothetical protein G52EAM_00633 [Candidatus Nanoperiomorbus periodonticus]|nr:hypothetical protein G52EAM_00633 [Candidatus Nanoperiomorbus periodonticus]